MLGLFNPLDILGLLGLAFLSLLGYLPITHSLSINRGLCIHYYYKTQYNIVHYSLSLSTIYLTWYHSHFLVASNKRFQHFPVLLPATSSFRLSACPQVVFRSKSLPRLQRSLICENLSYIHVYKV